MVINLDYENLTSVSILVSALVSNESITIPCYFGSRTDIFSFSNEFEDMSDPSLYSSSIYYQRL